MTCGYADCDEEITDQQYTFIYFSEAKLHKPVHNYHLSFNRKASDEVQTTDD